MLRLSGGSPASGTEELPSPFRVCNLSRVGHRGPDEVDDVALPSRLQPAFADRLLRPVVFMRPERLEDSAWLGHVPFAFWLAEAAKPQCFVELGTQTGVSYCAFLQAAARLAFPVKAFAVDTWAGDPHAGTYSEHVFENLSCHHNARYGSFSTLLRMTFDQAVRYFDDRSIDILHIDGYHTYEAVAHDFTSWLPKLSSRGVVLLHDINVHEREFGVWRLWAEQSACYPSFQFVHSYGLVFLQLDRNHPSRYGGSSVSPAILNAPAKSGIFFLP